MSDQTFTPQPQLSGAPFTDTHPRQQYRGQKPMVLLVLDGWGIGPNNAGNAIARAHTPNMDKFWLTFPHTQLAASGEAVGLPRSEDGNTETGHLNIGAGSIVYQDLPRINMSIADGTFNINPAFQNTFNHVKAHNSTLHLMGLIGAGGVHSNIEHLYALLNLCKAQSIPRVFIHGFTDGRDSPPTSGITYVQQIMDLCHKLGVGELASLTGRYYAMDRDKRWERVEKAYNMLTMGTGSCTQDPIAAMQAQYAQNITDEFIEPITICNADGTPRVVNDNDAIIFFNYRIDRPRELTKAFVLPNFESGITDEGFDPYSIKYEKTHLKQAVGGSTFQRQKLVHNLYFTTMTRYEEGLPVDVAFPPQFIKNPICKVFADHGLKQLRMAETEKERFVTYYMNGQQETIYPGEDRVIIPSKGAKSYDQVPDMSARELGAEMIKRIQGGDYDVIVANFANADMVAHTGNLEATIQACQTLDEVVGQIVKEVFARDGVVLITADHGNAEELINNTTGEVDTEHSIYPVPFIIIGKQFMGKSTMLPTGILADVAPTMLNIMGIPKPETMTGRALV
ncbi:MAG TPA: 2,3-bisphosphoglycerate-independent phosphoglycerate mutase [Vitreimonas sp.]|nr:2,3-bisphosphoglycerate-independent phosphoglycerate mutase [Vitreimonas sp.]